MTVHCFQVFADNGIAIDKANKRVDDYLFANFNDLLSEQHDLGIIEDLQGNQWISGIVRFELKESKQDILDKIESEVVHDLSWYRIRYHECNHDNPDEEEGTWSTLSEHGTIPDYV